MCDNSINASETLNFTDPYTIYINFRYSNRLYAQYVDLCVNYIHKIGGNMFLSILEKCQKLMQSIQAFPKP